MGRWTPPSHCYLQQELFTLPCATIYWQIPKTDFESADEHFHPFVMVITMVLTVISMMTMALLRICRSDGMTLSDIDHIALVSRSWQALTVNWSNGWISYYSVGSITLSERSVLYKFWFFFWANRLEQDHVQKFLAFFSRNNVSHNKFLFWKAHSSHKGAESHNCINGLNENLKWVKQGYVEYFKGR